MYHSKLIQLYQSLDSQELEGLHKWLRSPLHNNDELVLKLFLYIKSKRKLTERSLNRTKAFKALYVSNKYDDLKLRHLMSKLVQSIEQFVVFWMSKHNPIHQELTLTQFFNKKGLFKLAQQQIQHWNQRLSKLPIQDHQTYYQHYLLSQEVFEQEAMQSRTKATNLQEVITNLSTSFVIEYLRYACIAISHQNIYKTQYQFELLPAITELVEKSPYREVTAIRLYYNAYWTHTHEAPDPYFEALKEDLSQSTQLLQQDELSGLYKLVINYCIKRINTDESNIYMQQVFAWYQKGVEQGVLLEHGHLSRFTYKNIMTVALRLHEYEWVREHITAYGALLKEDYQSNYQHYSTAKLYFETGEYDKARRWLLQVEYDDLFLNLDAKTMLMKMYYQEDSTDALESLFHSFSIYLQRKDIMGYHQTNYRNIIKFTKKLLFLAPYDTVGLAKLKQQVEETNPLTERVWLLAQLEKR